MVFFLQCAPAVNLLGVCESVEVKEIGDEEVGVLHIICQMWQKILPIIVLSFDEMEENTAGRWRLWLVNWISHCQVTVFECGGEGGRIATIIVRGASQSRIDDVERAVDDAVNYYKALTKDGKVSIYWAVYKYTSTLFHLMYYLLRPWCSKTTTLYLSSLYIYYWGYTWLVIGEVCFLQLLAGAGAVEIELSRQMESWGEKCAGLEQYAIKKFAHALETLPKCIAENGGVNVSIRITVKYLFIYFFTFVTLAGNGTAHSSVCCSWSWRCQCRSRHYRG